MNRPLSQPAPSSPVTPFPAQFERCAQEVRGALTELFAATRTDPSVPQAVARRLGLNKNLAWKVCKIVNSPDVYHSVPHLPGNAGVDILLRAFGKAGADEARLLAVRAALEAFDAMIELHAGDRATFELMIDSCLAEREPSPRLHQARKLAFQGNGAVLGVRTRVRVAATILAPSAVDPGYLEVTVMSGLVDLERLRPNATWPVVRYHAHIEDGDRPAVEPLDPGGSGPDGAPLLARFCSAPLPEISARAQPEGTVFDLAPGPVGKTAKSTLVFGWTFPRFAPARAQTPGERAEYFVRVDTPAEQLVFDLLVHRDLDFVLPPEADCFSLVPGPPVDSVTASPTNLLPRTESVQELGVGPPVLASPHFGGHAEIVRWCVERRGRSLGEFRGYRLSTAFPPVPSLGVLHFPLPA